jgi:hypothetical protein
MPKITVKEAWERLCSGEFQKLTYPNPWGYEVLSDHEFYLEKGNDIIVASLQGQTVLECIDADGGECWHLDASKQQWGKV